MHSLTVKITDMFKQGLIEHEITRRYYSHHNDLMLTSDGYSGSVLTLNHPYQHIFGRTPSRTELEPFFRAIREGSSKKKMLKSILYSKESLTRHKVPPKGIYFSILGLLFTRSERFVPNLFMQILNRPPREEEVVIWKKRQRLLTKLGALALFLRVTEYKINFKIPTVSSFTFVLSFKFRRSYKLVWFKIKEHLRHALSRLKNKPQKSAGIDE